MTKARPVFLELWRIRLPISALVSILHRISGVLMVLSIPIAAALFAQALSGPAGFAASAAFVGHPLIRFGLLVMLWALLHHLFAGIRYLIIDLGVGVERPVARQTAKAALLAGLAAAALGGMFL
ncbi:MAG: succinate dehydrogenase, cytochrome b556 subunit [Chromatiaceae bacterium]|nr:MAG: succinate dehydrogenase, cytochrome b556 subunit [Chromatiaceae bacterium]